MSAIDKVLGLLQRVKKSKPGTWMSACPCCDSQKGRPLAITETADGKVLLHAFCGCQTEHVLGALGLELTDLFEAPITPHRPSRFTRVPSGDVLNAMATEATVVAVLASDFLTNKQIDEQGWNRLASAVRRLNHARDYIDWRAK